MDILLYTLRSEAEALLDPGLALVLILLAVMLYRQNTKTTVMQKMIIGERINSPFELTISQIVIGIFAGVAGSIILSYLGVAFDENSAIFLIFIISIIFMFWNPKFICFAYSGGLIGLISILLELISKVYSKTSINLMGTIINLKDINILKIDVGALMTMVAVLHLVEGILVMIDGKRGTIPVFSNRDNKIIGGFAFKRYWALPIALLLIMNKTDVSGLTEQVATPGWWPLLKISALHFIKDAAIMLTPFYGVIGYNGVTFTRGKSEKTFVSGTALIIYSIALFLVAQLTPLGYFYKIAAVIFAPAAHEFMLYYTRYLEVKGKPKFVSSEDGIMVLEVAPNSPAEEMGIKSGDLLVEVNGKKIDTEQDVLAAAKEVGSFIYFKIKKVTSELKEVSYNKMNSGKRLGIVLVPRNIPGDSIVVKYDEGKFKDVLDKLKNKDDDE